MGKRAIMVVLIIIVLGAGAAALALMSKNPDSNTGMPRDDASKQTTNQSVTNNAQTDNNTSAQKSTVAIKDYAYAPSNITVKVGDTVTWTNQDPVGHTVTAESGEGPDSPLIDQGQSYSYTFTKAGTYSYFCKPHPYMKASVTVTE